MNVLASNKDAFEALQSIATVVALFVGGIWTYRLFVQKREKYPRASVAHRASHWCMGESHRLIRVTVTVKNESKVLLCLANGYTWLQQMEPWPEELLQQLPSGGAVVEEKAREYPWPLLAAHDFAFDGQKELEPEEVDEVIHDFIIPIIYTRVLVYTWLENRAKPGRNMGWTASTILEINLPDSQTEELVMADDSNTKGDWRTRQAEPKPKPPAAKPVQPVVKRPNQSNVSNQTKKAS